MIKNKDWVARAAKKILRGRRIKRRKPTGLVFLKPRRSGAHQADVDMQDYVELHRAIKENDLNKAMGYFKAVLKPPGKENIGKMALLVEDDKPSFGEYFARRRTFVGGLGRGMFIPSYPGVGKSMSLFGTIESDNIIGKEMTDEHILKRLGSMGPIFASSPPESYDAPKASSLFFDESMLQVKSDELGNITTRVITKDELYKKPEDGKSK